MYETDDLENYLKHVCNFFHNREIIYFSSLAFIGALHPLLYIIIVLSDHFSSSLIISVMFTGLIQVFNCLSCMAEPKSGQGSPNVVVQTLNHRITWRELITLLELLATQFQSVAVKITLRVSLIYNSS